MKRALNILILLAFCMSAFSQTSLLNDFNFENGGYSLVGIRSAKLKKTFLMDTLKDFYTNDIKILNEFKKEWVFNKTNDGFKYDFHYTIYICKNGISIEQFNINLSSNEITSAKGTFFFDSNKLISFKRKVKKAYRRTDEFKTLKQAREYKSSITTDKNLVFITPPIWNEYDGSFSFDGSNGDSLTIREISLTKLTAEIKKVYPYENFELEDLGNVYVGTKCQKALAMKFKLYPIWDQWGEYHPILTTYWMNDIK